MAVYFPKQSPIKYRAVTAVNLPKQSRFSRPSDTAFPVNHFIFRDLNIKTVQ